MIVHVPVPEVAAVLIYLLAMTGIPLLALTALSALGSSLSRIWRMVPPNGRSSTKGVSTRCSPSRHFPGRATTWVTALEPPSTPATILATRLDLAERGDASTPVTSSSSLITSTGEPSRMRITHSRDANLSAGDIFNRSFGVLTVAAN
jgi:hypothetical protein